MHANKPLFLTRKDIAQTRSYPLIFSNLKKKQRKSGLDSEFSFSEATCFSKDKNLN